MPFIKKNEVDFSVSNDKILLNKEYLQKNKKLFKKITGTRFSAILGLSKYTSPFKTWTIMTNLYKETIDPTLAKVGNAIEPKVREYVEGQLNCKYMVYNPIAVKWDVFQDNPIFGGIPDGEPINESHLIDYSKFPMLEIKTSSIDSFIYKRVDNCLQMQKDENGYPVIKQRNQKIQSWFDQNNNIKIPVEYQYQLGLYMYLRKINYGMFAVAFLNQEDYVNPEKFDANNHQIYLVKAKSINNEQFVSDIAFAKKWYQDYIETGISPKMTEEDKKWLNSELKYSK